MIQFNHLQEALKEYADAIRDQYKDNLERDNRRATGDLITSVNTKININGDEFVIELQLENYWEYVEWDTKPHIPPFNKILDWVRVKRILPMPMKNGKLPTEEQLAWMITNKISKDGTEGTHDLEDALVEVDYENIIEEALDQDVLECIDEILLLK